MQKVYAHRFYWKIGYQICASSVKQEINKMNNNNMNIWRIVWWLVP